MSLTKLAGTFRSQAAASKGYITIDSSVLTNDGFTPQDGLDTLLKQSFCLANGGTFQVNTSGQTIPDPEGNVLTINGTLSISKIAITEEMTAVVLILTASDTSISFTVATQLTGWKFTTSFQFMVGYPFDQMPYGNPALVFSTADSSSFNWINGAIAIKAGQNFASTLGLTGYLKPVVSFLTSWDPNTTIPFAGPIKIDKVDNETILYPDADWRATINASLQPLSFLNIGNPFIRLVIETITGNNDEDGEQAAEPETEQTPQLFFGMSLQAGNDIQIDFSTVWLKNNNSITIATTSPPNKPLSAMNLINLMANQNYLGFIPPTLQQFLQVFTFKTFAVSLALDTKKISSIGATIGSNGGWQLFSDFTIKEFDFVWTVMEPSRLSSSLYYFESEFEFFPSIFKQPDGSPGLFHIRINNQLQFSGSYRGSVSLNDLVSGITKGAVSIPTSIASVKFSDFFVSMDVPNKTYQLSANTDIELNIITNIAIKETTFTINSSTPATGKGDPKFSANITGSFILAGLYLGVNVDYTKEGSNSLWKLDIEMLPGESINLGNLMAQMFKAISLPTSFLPANLAVTQFSANAEIPNTGTSSYEVKTGLQWKFTFPIIDQQVNILANLWIKLDGGSYSGGVIGSIKLDYFNAIIDIGYNFSDNDQQLMMQWEGFVAKYDVAGQSRTLTFSIENWTLGGLITSFMKMLFNPTFELSAPWSALNSVSLDGFSVTYNLDTKEVNVHYALPRSLDLVFITINGITLTKNSDGVFIAFDGSSVVPAINDSNLFKHSSAAQNGGGGNPGQDVTNMPDVPGQGAEYFDLRLLAMGQHVELVNGSQYKSIKDVAEAMQKAFTEPAEGTVPVGPGSGTSSLLAFNENSNWLIATNFGILNSGTKDKPVWTVDMQVLFNDPSLYGLRIALNGDKAKVLKGLEFEIMYKKISDSIGVYQIDLTLPDTLRNLQFGAVNVTLPSISLEIFTNGDFMVDIGFPHNMDFSRSFTLQAIVPPGIPAMGSGGFYFGKLSSATTSKVPTTTYGNFNPVIVFGLGLQVGIGYSINRGILSAGFSITFFGVIEGVIATYHPYIGAADQSNPAVVETSYYYFLQGTIGIIGKLYGSIDFGIISASINVTLMVYAQATFEAYHKIPLAIVASVEVEVSVSIDLGLFSITIHFSFSATIRQDLTIGTDNTANAPWNRQLPTSKEKAMLFAAALPLMDVTPLPDKLLFLSTLTADAGVAQPTLNIYFVPHLSIAGPENGALADQKPQYATTLFIDAPDPKGSTGATSFEQLCADFFSWLILNYKNPTAANNASRKQVQAMGVSAADLKQIITLLSDKNNPFPIPTDKLLAFLKNSFKAVNVQSLTSQLPSVAVFPMFFDLQLNVPAIPLNIDFSKYNMANAAYLKNVKDWFAQMAVKVQQETQAPPRLALAETSYSISTFVFEDYFVLLGKQLAGYASDAMANFTYNLTKNANGLAGMVSWANGIKDGTNQVSVQSVAVANQSHPFNAGITISVTGQMHQLAGTDTFASVAARYAVAPVTLLSQNANVPGLLAIQTIRFNGNSYNVQLTDTLTTVATGLKTTLQTLSADAGFLQSTNMQAGNWLVIGAAIYTARNADTFAAVASTVYNNIDVQALLMQNQVTPGLFIAGNKFSYNNTDYTIVPGDTLFSMAANLSKGGATVTPQNLASNINVQKLSIQPLGQMLIQPFTYTTVAFTDPAKADTLASIAARYNSTVQSLSACYANQQINNLFYNGVGYTKANIPGLTYLDVASILQYFADNSSFSRLSGMASRYQLHGMRLPTTLPGLTLSPGAPCYSDTDCALFSLTGQQFTLPAKVEAGFSIQLVNKTLDWLQFNGQVMDSKKDNVLEVKLIDKDLTQISTLLSYVQKNGVVPKVQRLEPMKPYDLLPVHYTFQTTTRWQTSGTLNLPYGSLGNQSDASPLIWEFPSGLTRQLALPRKAGSQFSIQIGQHSAATGLMDYNPSSYYGWSTMVKIDVKKRAGSPVSSVNAYTYDLLGADEAGANVLQSLLLALDPQAQDNNRSKIIDIQWLYEGDGGLLSVGMNNMKSFVVQANLSTETNPSKSLMLAMAPLTAATMPTTGILNSTYDFIRLLWECSITRSGGYYLLYNELKANAGFPDSVFGRGDTATVRLLVTYSSQYNNKPASYMNCAVTADKINAASCVVYAQSEQQKGITATVQATSDTLSSIASGYNILLSEIASLNAGIALNIAVNPVPVIKLSGLVYENGWMASANDLQSIAKYYNVDPTALQQMNTGIDFNKLPMWQLVLIPDVTYAVANTKGGPGNTLESIAKYYFIDMSVLAWAVKDVANLFTVSTALTINDQILHKVSNIPQGTAGFKLKRTNPGLPPAVTDPGYADAYLSNMYNLLSYQVVDNPWFKVSRVALPAGPATNKNQDQLLGKNNGAQANDSNWKYNQVIPIAQFAKQNQKMNYPAGYPQEKDNPYRGIGHWVQVHFDWVDYYGNETITPFSTPVLDPSTPVNNPPIPIGYTDELRGFGKWPSLELSYLFDQDSNNNPKLNLLFNFNDKRYVPIPNVPDAQQQDWKQNAANDLAIYTTIYYQLIQLDPATGNNTMSITLRSSLTGKDMVLSGTQLNQLQQFVKDTYTYLLARSQGNTGTVPVLQPISISIKPGDIDLSSILLLTVDVEFSRDLAFVNQDFRDSNLVVRSNTQVKPKTQQTSADGNQHSLSDFAAKFEAAFISPGNYVLKIASGTNSTMAANSSSNQAIFVVRMGLKPGNGIYWTLPQAGTYQLTSDSIAQLKAANVPDSVTGALTPLINKFFASRDAFDMELQKILSAADFNQYQVAIYTYSLLNPVFYAPKPLANSLISKNDVPVCSYITGKGLDCSGNNKRNFTGIDMDTWGAQSLDAIDVFLSSEFSVPAFLVDQLMADDEKAWLKQQNISADSCLEAITNAKKSLAKTISGELSPILTAPHISDQAGMTNAQQQLEQQLLIQLGNAYKINALVQLKVTAQSDFVGSGNNNTPPRLYGVPLMNNVDTERKSEYSISTAKVQLNGKNPGSNSSYLTFAFSTSNAKEATNVPLDISYVVTHIEFEISDVPGIKGYQGSNWLTFIIPADITSKQLNAQGVLKQELGQMNIPIVLRNYPIPPTLTIQECDPVAISGADTQTRLKKASQWDYLYTFTKDQAAQDKIFSDIEFNFVKNKFTANARAASRDLFSDMAQIVEVWPQLLHDFNKYLSAITAQSTTSDPNLANAYYALQTIVTLSNNLAIAWSEFTGTLAQNIAANGNKRVYDFIIRQVNDTDYGNIMRAIIVPQDSIPASQLQLFRNGQAVDEATLPDVPYISIDGYNTVPAKDNKGAVVPNEYWFQTPGQNPVYLSWAQSFNIQARTVNVNDLNVLQYQYAWASLSVIRNEDLVPLNPTVNNFIYRTPLVRFANKLIPLLSSDDLIDIAKLTNELGVNLALAQHLANFFSIFFTYDELKMQQIKLSASWNYTLSSQPGGPLPAIQLPVLLLTPNDFNIPDDYTLPAGGCSATPGSTDPFICRLAAALKTWYSQVLPVTNNAWFQFDLSVFSTTGGSQLPLIELRDIVLYFQNISDMSSQLSELFF